jgi:hypothetical protein
MNIRAADACANGPTIHNPTVKKIRALAFRGGFFRIGFSLT